MQKIILCPETLKRIQTSPHFLLKEQFRANGTEYCYGQHCCDPLILAYKNERSQNFVISLRDMTEEEIREVLHALKQPLATE